MLQFLPKLQTNNKGIFSCSIGWRTMMARALVRAENTHVLQSYSKACMQWSELKRKYKDGRAGHQEKRYSLSIIRDVSKLSVNSGDFGHNILSPKKL